MGHDATGVSGSVVVCNGIAAKYAGSVIANCSGGSATSSAVAVNAGIADGDTCLVVYINATAMAAGAVVINAGIGNRDTRAVAACVNTATAMGGFVAAKYGIIKSQTSTSNSYRAAGYASVVPINNANAIKAA